MPSFEGRPGHYFFCGREAALVDELVNASDKDRVEELVRAGHDPAFRMKLVEADGVAAEVVNATWTLYTMRIVDGELRRACCRVFNDWVSEYCSENLKRLVGVAMIPIDDVPWAVAELGRVARKGLRGAMIATNPPEGARPYRDGCYDPFWAAAEEAGVPITLHIVTGRVRDPFTYHGEEERGEVPRSFIELFHEALPVLAGEFIFGGIFDRFPRLKLVVAEYEASWIPHFRFRLDRIERFPGLRTLEKRARLPAREHLRGDHQRPPRRRHAARDRGRPDHVGLGLPASAVHVPEDARGPRPDPRRRSRRRAAPDRRRQRHGALRHRALIPSPPRGGRGR